MAGPPSEEASEIVKYLLMLGSILLGLGARIAGVWREKKMDFKTVAIETMIAIPAGMLVYEILKYTGHEKAAPICGIITGKFAQDVFSLIWRIIKSFIKTSAEEIK
jgi:hypothetical protein